MHAVEGLRTRNSSWMLTVIATIFGIVAVGGNPLIANERLPDSFVIAATISTESTSSDGSVIVKDQPLVIAVTPERGLAGWRSNEEQVEFFTYIESSNGVRVALEFEFKDSELNMIEASRRFAQALEDTPFQGPVIARLSEYSQIINKDLSLLLCSGTLGIQRNDVQQMLDSGEKDRTFSTGILSLVTNDGIAAISFQCRSTDLLSAEGDTLLRDAKHRRYPDGLRSISIKSEFSPPRNYNYSAPRTIRNEFQMVGADGTIVRQDTTTISVLDESSDPAIVDSFIERILEAVPRGQQLISNSNEAKVLDYGKIRKAIDFEALAEAEQARLSGRSGLSGYILLAGIIFLLVFVLWQFRKR